MDWIYFRAAFVPEPLVVDALQKMADWCLKYTREEDRRGGLPPIPSAAALHVLGPQETHTRHAAFFATCQALLYTLCYHMEPLLRRLERPAHQPVNARSDGQQLHHEYLKLEEQPSTHGSGAKAEAEAARRAWPLPNGNGTSDMKARGDADDQGQVLEACAVALNGIFIDVMPRLLSHSLDPLSSCAYSVVIEFGRQAGSLGHAHLQTLVQEWERRRGGIKIAERTSGAAPSRPLEVFFPFDPYLLRRSSRHLDLPATYVRWRRGHPAGAARAGLRLIDGGSPGGQIYDGDSSGLDLSSDEEEDAQEISSDEDDEVAGISGASGDSGDDDVDDDSATSSDDADDLRRTRFGSMPDSSLSSGGRRRSFGSRRRLPGALKASLAMGGQGGSPTMGVAIPGGSVSTDNGSPWGLSPVNGYHGSFAPMSYTGNG